VGSSIVHENGRSNTLHTGKFYTDRSEIDGQNSLPDTQALSFSFLKSSLGISVDENKYEMYTNRAN
jgi:hypothetical protein